MKRFQKQCQFGFTTLETVVVIAMISVMAVTIGPGFGGMSTFKVQTAKSDFISIARFAQESAMWRGDSSRIQLVMDHSAAQLRVEAFTSTACPATGTPIVLRTLTMREDVDYPSAGGADSIVQFTPIGEVDCYAPAWGYATDPPDLDWSFDAGLYSEFCIEDSGFAHEGSCYN